MTFLKGKHNDNTVNYAKSLLTFSMVGAQSQRVWLGLVGTACRTYMYGNVYTVLTGCCIIDHVAADYNITDLKIAKLAFLWPYFLRKHSWLKLKHVSFKPNSTITQITEQAVLGKLSGYYTQRVILDQSLSLPRFLHLFEKKLL